MSTLNYLLEANLGLCLFLLVYRTLLQKENDFGWKRVFLLMGVFTSVVFPLFHFNTSGHVIPSLEDVLPTRWLPEITIQGENTSASHEVTDSYGFWFYITLIYGAGILFFLLQFLLRLGYLLRLMKHAQSYRLEGIRITESMEDKPTFSFFRFIFIGQCHELSDNEKQQIIRHERVHAQRFHSFDVLILNILSVFFWFNPFLKTYKKIFVQLHEFEADARAVDNRELDDYCNLLARVALLSADIKLANHFNYSLTVKRIEMMRTIKKKIQMWKMAAVTLVVPVFFFVVACQDQVISEAVEIAKSSTMPLDVPENIQQEYDRMQKANPEAKFLLIEVDDKGKAKLESMQSALNNLKGEQISTLNVYKIPKTDTDPERGFLLIKYDDRIMLKITEAAGKEGNVFTVVEESATPKDGFDMFSRYIAQNLIYPTEARKKGLEGKVFVEFIVQEDGTLTDFNILKGVDPLLDNEAMRIVKTSPQWLPGKQKGIAVKQKMVMPILFKLSDSNTTDDTENPQGSLNEVTAVGYRSN
jgi:TonB family protein